MAPKGGEKAHAALSHDGTYTVAEIARHNNKDDCWLIVDRKVYDATSFLSDHPGGDILASWAGADASSVFSVFHPKDARSLLSSLYLGEVADPKDRAVDKDYFALRDEFLAEGLYDASAVYYTFKVLFNTGMLVTAFWILATFGQSLLGVIAGSVMMALFWQQCGWLSHDFLHHQVFKNRTLNNLMGYFLGNFYQGFSVKWWKAKHNLHHSVPNVVEGVRDGDPDIQTLPFLAWGDLVLEHGEIGPGLPAFLVRNQSLVYFPLLCVARVSWLLQSIMGVSKPETNSSKWWLEVVGLAMHWTYYLYAGLFLVNPSYRLVYFAVTQAACGLFLGTVFTLGHNGMDVMDSNSVNSTDFVSLQARTTRDVTASWWADWFTGGLDYQFEHHLFPMIPRHNFHKIKPRVMALCKKHNIPYKETGFMEGSYEVMDRLRQVQTAFAAGNPKKQS